MGSRHKRLGLLFLLTGILFWSTAEVVIRTIVTQITPIQLAFARLVIGSALLLCFLPWELRRKELHLTPRIIAHSAWLSAIGIVCTNLSHQYALKYSGASIVATMFGTSPLFTLIVAAIVLREPATRARIIGVVLGFIGIAVLAASKPSETFSLLGLTFALIMALAMAVFLVCIKRTAGPYAGLTITTLCMVWGMIFMLPLLLWEADMSTLAQIPQIWPEVLYLGLCTTGIAYYLYYTGLERVDATQAASTLFLKPPLATALAIVVLHEPLTWNLGVALLLILAGLYMIMARSA